MEPELYPVAIGIPLAIIAWLTLFIIVFISWRREEVQRRNIERRRMSYVRMDAQLTEDLYTKNLKRQGDIIRSGEGLEDVYERLTKESSIG